MQQQTRYHPLPDPWRALQHPVLLYGCCQQANSAPRSLCMSPARTSARPRTARAGWTPARCQCWSACTGRLVQGHTSVMQMGQEQSAYSCRPAKSHASCLRACGLPEVRALTLPLPTMYCLAGRVRTRDAARDLRADARVAACVQRQLVDHRLHLAALFPERHAHVDLHLRGVQQHLEDRQVLDQRVCVACCAEAAQQQATTAADRSRVPLT